MPEVVICTLERENRYWRPELFPGSEEAAASGCCCPIEQPWPGALVFDVECAVHQLEPQKKN